jgi:hypothetical protein
MRFIVSYTINESNDQFPSSVLWQGNIEKETLQDAIQILENLQNIDPRYTQSAFPYFGTLTRIAIFKLDGKRTFRNKPRRLFDRRDKRDWLIVGLDGLINRYDAGYF